MPLTIGVDAGAGVFDDRGDGAERAVGIDRQDGNIARAVIGHDRAGARGIDIDVGRIFSLGHLFVEGGQCTGRGIDGKSGDGGGAMIVLRADGKEEFPAGGNYLPAGIADFRRQGWRGDFTGGRVESAQIDPLAFAGGIAVGAKVDPELRSRGCGPGPGTAHHREHTEDGKNRRAIHAIAFPHGISPYIFRSQ